MKHRARRRLFHQLAEHLDCDLELRGPGDFFGTRQHGLPTLRAGDLTRDVDLLERAFEEARTRVDGRTLSPALQDYVRSVWQRQFGLIAVG